MLSAAEFPTAPAPTVIRRNLPGLKAAAICLAAALGLLAGSSSANAATVEVNLVAKQAVVDVAPGAKLRAWTFNGSVPGPVVRVTEGDTIQVNLTNSDQGTPAKTVKKCKKVRVKKRIKKPKAGKKKFRWVWKKRCRKVKVPGRVGQPHSIDFHAAEIAPNQAFKSIAPGQSHSFSFLAARPGVYMYHCGTPMMLEHIAMGMYGMIIVDPATPPVPAPVQEINLVQSEFYGKVKNGWLEQDRHSMMHGDPLYVTFNGQANRYVQDPIQVPVGGPADPPVRINFVNAGPSNFSAFHVVGTIFDRYLPDGHVASLMQDVSTQTIAPGGGGAFELHFTAPGKYPVVSHAMRDMEKGAMGFFEAS